MRAPETKTPSIEGLAYCEVFLVVEYSTPDDDPPVILRQWWQNARSVGKSEEGKRSSMIPHHFPAHHERPLTKPTCFRAMVIWITGMHRLPSPHLDHC